MRISAIHGEYAALRRVFADVRRRAQPPQIRALPRDRRFWLRSAQAAFGGRQGHSGPLSHPDLTLRSTDLAAHARDFVAHEIEFHSAERSPSTSPNLRMTVASPQQAAIAWSAAVSSSEEAAS